MKQTALLCLFAVCAAHAELRIGIVGTDTSHVPAFTKLLNDSQSPDHVAGGRVVAAYKGGSKDMKESFTRVDKFADEISTKYGVKIVPSIETLCKMVDVVLLESVDGRTHLQQAKAVIAAGKPVFIDKPLASTLEDAREIARLAKAAGVPWFSASSLRYSEIVTSLKQPDIFAAFTWGPGPLEEHHQLDLSYYAIHPIEMLYTIMGRGCEEVTRTVGGNSDVVTCRWKDGRTGTVEALRPYGDYGAAVFRPKEVNQSRPKMGTGGYRALLVEVMKFFETKEPPVPNEDTLEMFAFMDAAQRSKAEGGKPMKLR